MCGRYIFGRITGILFDCTREIFGRTTRIGRCGRPHELVLMSENRGLPETGLDDGSTAELGSLEMTQMVIRNFLLRMCEITHFIQLVEHLDGGLPVDASIGDADTILESRGT